MPESPAKIPPPPFWGLRLLGQREGRIIRPWWGRIIRPQRQSSDAATLQHTLKDPWYCYLTLKTLGIKKCSFRWPGTAINESLEIQGRILKEPTPRQDREGSFRLWLVASLDFPS